MRLRLLGTLHIEPRLQNMHKCTWYACPHDSPHVRPHERLNPRTCLRVRARACADGGRRRPAAFSLRLALLVGGRGAVLAAAARAVHLLLDRAAERPIRPRRQERGGGAAARRVCAE
eukprot:3235657-Pleurochrysis_carterae.AAC.1